MIEPGASRDRESAGTDHAIHATAIVVGESGILLRGRSGAGKSKLALALLDLAGSRGLFARLVSDDRVLLRTHHGRVVASVHPAIAGRIELRGVGILEVPHEPAAVLRLVAEIDPDVGCGLAPRLPEPDQRMTVLDGVALPCVRLCSEWGPSDMALTVWLVLGNLARRW